MKKKQNQGLIAKPIALKLSLVDKERLQLFCKREHLVPTAFVRAVILKKLDEIDIRNSNEQLN